MEKCGRTAQATADNMVHAHCMLDTEGYKHTLRICNTYCFSTTLGFTKAPDCYVTRTVPVLLVMVKYCMPCALQG